MGRAATCAWLAVVLCGPLALAQDKEATPPGAAAPPAEAPPAEAPSAEAPSAEAPPAEAPAAEPPAAGPPKEGAEVVTPSEQIRSPEAGWKDIVAVPRRAVLKRRRLEIMPTYNVTMNNSLVRHHGFGGQLNFYLTEALFIGVEGTWYQKQLLDRYYLIGREERVLASVNRYNWSAFLDFGYVPIYGKFTFFGAGVLHWDVWIAGGVGVINTEIIPKDPANATFGGYRIAGLLPGVGTHLWFNRWLALDVYLKNYLFSDVLEPTNRVPGDCPSSDNCPASKDAPSQFTFDLVFGVGLSVMLPGYQYKTPR